MAGIKEISQHNYDPDFEISNNYISFSSELLRISLLAIGGFGTILMIQAKGESSDLVSSILKEPLLILISMTLFACCVGAALAHRYFASDSMSWFIAWLRAEESMNKEKAKDEKNGFIKLLKRSKYSLILSEICFGGGVLFFILSIYKLLL